MAGMPINFQAFSNVLPTYQFVDIVSGTGYITFYAGNTVDKNCLSNYAFYSNVIAVEEQNNNAAYTLIIDVDFDVTVNRPMSLAGLGIVNLPLRCEVASTHFVYATIILRKWDGVTETDIATNDTSEYTTPAYLMSCTDLTIPLTHFKKGDTLRLTINIYSKETALRTSGYAADPKNRVWDGVGTIPSQLSFLCPVRLNL